MGLVRGAGRPLTDCYLVFRHALWGTRWTVERRRYFFADFGCDGVAERVQAERHDSKAWVRVLDAIYWWPEHEGKEWPAEVIPVPVRGGGDTPEPDAWTHFETTLGMDERYRWEEVPGPIDLG